MDDEQVRQSLMKMYNQFKELIDVCGFKLVSDATYFEMVKKE